jgi:uncharacterized membrane protein
VAERFVNDFRRFFLRGLAAVLPTLLTVAIIILVFRFVHKNMGQYINQGAVYVVARVWAHGSYSDLHKDQGYTFDAFLDQKFNDLNVVWDTYLWWVGFLLAIAAIYIFGRFVASFLGRGVWGMVERGLFRTPVVRQIYPYVKQVTDFLFSEKKLEFSRVVAVEYPRKGVWSLGLVTGPGMRTLRGSLGTDLLTIFVPSSPTPVTGYTIAVRKEDVIDLPLSIDEALRFTVSGGVIVPLGQQLSAREIEEALQGALPPPDK